MAGRAERRGSGPLQDVGVRRGASSGLASVFGDNVDDIAFILTMRITLNLDDNAIEVLRQYSQTHSLTLGKAASELVRKGAACATPTRIVNGFVVFDIPPGGRKISSERVKELLE